MSELDRILARRIAVGGPIPVSELMTEALLNPRHGYYRRAAPIGRDGDFTTAPEISQVFGELIGAWLAERWQAIGRPDPVLLVELGPGRGTMMKDALRAVKVVPEFRTAVVAHLVEVSPLLQAQQEKTLEDAGVPIFWHATLADVPKGPAIILANEFFDALPVNQAIKTERGWHERRIQIDPNGELAFTIAPEPMPFFQTLLPPALRAPRAGAIFEWRADTAAIDLGRCIADNRGAGLVIDYGHTETCLGETLQAVGQHAYADPLTFPGSLDLTAHVDFQSLARAVEAMGVRGFGPIEQSQFLRRLGIEQRATTLKADRARAGEIDEALARLIGQNRTAMGELFKVAAFAHPSVGVLPGFEI